MRASAATAERAGERFRRIKHGTAASLLVQVVNVVAQLALVPVLLTSWGTQQYGEWLSLSATVAYLSILDLGVQTYATNRLTQCNATGDMDQYNRVLHSAWALNLGLAVLALIVMVPLLGVLPFHRWLHLQATGPLAAWLIASLLAVQTIGGIPFGLVTGIYRTLNEYPREQLTNVARQSLTVVASGAVALAGGGLLAVVLVQLASLAIPGIYAWRDVRTRYPRVRLGLERADYAMAVSFLHPSLLFLVLQLCGAAMLQGSTLLVGGLFGATGVATFVSLRTLSNVCQQGISSLRSALWPEVAAMEATGDYAGLRKVLVLLTKIHVLLWFCAALLLYFEGGTVVRLWAKGRIVYDAGVMHGLLLLVGSYTYWATSSVLLGASNRHRTMTWVYAAGSTVGLTLGYLLTRPFGLAGIAYGTAAADAAICAVWIPRLTCRLIGHSYRRFCRDVLGRGAIAVLPAAALATLFHRALPMGSDVVRIALLAAVIGLCGSMAFYTIWLDGDERRRIAGALHLTRVLYPGS